MASTKTLCRAIHLGLAGCLGVAVAQNQPIQLADLETASGGFRLIHPGATAHAAGVGDVNGDGLDDIAVALSESVLTPPLGAYIVFGKRDTMPVELPLNEGEGFAILGSLSTITGAGDVNGDGLADLVVAVPQPDFSGLAWVVFGKTDAGSVVISAAEKPGFAISHAGHVGFSGLAAGTAGDINGDGFDDVLIGATSSGPDGEAFLVFGSSTPDDVELTSAAFSGVSIIGEDRQLGRDGGGTYSYGYGLGSSVSAAGDVDGDGLADVIVSTPATRCASNLCFGEQPGRSYVVFGRTGGSSIDLGDPNFGGFSVTGGRTPVGFGVGDVNSDGLDDIAVMQAGLVPVSRGATTVIFGGPEIEDASLHPAAGEGFVVGSEDITLGSASAPVGDFNGDGNADLAVSALSEETVFVLFGKSDSNPIDPVFLGDSGVRISGANAASLAGGDINADGVGDVVIGSMDQSFAVFGTIPIPARDDHGDSIPLATAVPFGETVSGQIDFAGDADVLSIVLPDSGRLRVGVVSSQDLHLQVLDKLGNLLETGRRESASSLVIARNLPAGDYFIEVSGIGRAMGSYELDMALSALASLPQSRETLAFLDTEADRACPGFFIARVDALQESEGFWTLEGRLQGERSRRLQGGINFGGGFGNRKTPGFAAFSVPQSQAQPLLVSIDAVAAKPQGMTYQMDLVRRSSGENVVVASCQSDSESARLHDIALDPGFYSVRIFAVGDHPGAASFNMSLQGRFADMAGGSFDSGFVVGGYMTAGTQYGSNTGFGAICIDESQTSIFRADGANRYGPVGAFDIGLTILNHRRSVISSNP